MHHRPGLWVEEGEGWPGWAPTAQAQTQGTEEQAQARALGAVTAEADAGGKQVPKSWSARAGARPISPIAQPTRSLPPPNITFHPVPCPVPTTHQTSQPQGLCACSLSLDSSCQTFTGGWAPLPLKAASWVPGQSSPHSPCLCASSSYYNPNPQGHIYCLSPRLWAHGSRSLPVSSVSLAAASPAQGRGAAHGAGHGQYLLREGVSTDERHGFLCLQFTRSPLDGLALWSGAVPPGATFPLICCEGPGDVWGCLGTSGSWLPTDSWGVCSSGWSQADPQQGPAFHTWGQEQPGCWLESVVPHLEPFGEKCAFLRASWLQEISTYSCANTGSPVAGPLTSEGRRGRGAGGLRLLRAQEPRPCRHTEPGR